MTSLSAPLPAGAGARLGLFCFFSLPEPSFIGNGIVSRRCGFGLLAAFRCCVFGASPTEVRGEAIVAGSIADVPAADRRLKVHPIGWPARRC